MIDELIGLIEELEGRAGMLAPTREGDAARTQVLEAAGNIRAILKKHGHEVAPIPDKLQACIMKILDAPR